MKNLARSLGPCLFVLLPLTASAAPLALRDRSYALEVSSRTSDPSVASWRCQLSGKIVARSDSSGRVIQAVIRPESVFLNGNGLDVRRSVIRLSAEDIAGASIDVVTRRSLSSRWGDGLTVKTQTDRLQGLRITTATFGKITALMGRVCGEQFSGSAVLADAVREGTAFRSFSLKDDKIRKLALYSKARLEQASYRLTLGRNAARLD
jgi:hypothetical protein